DERRAAMNDRCELHRDGFLVVMTRRCRSACGVLARIYRAEAMESCPRSIDPGRPPSSGLLLAPPLVLAQQFLPQADARRRDLDELVVVDELERLLEREADRRRQQDVLVVRGGADVRQVLLARGIHRQVVSPAVYADDHPFVDLVAGADEQ